ncbi:unnamed protein product [Somion occarium]|uniref:Uncharacterized protein n=1 Tax=Somion occarium TaxID=3059160 RepID=A0ABP1CRM8_9APHY
MMSDAKIQTQPIPIPPVQLKWAAYEPIPDSWLLGGSPGLPSASLVSDSFSIFFGSASTSSSIRSSKDESRRNSESSAVRDSSEPAVDALAEEELQSFFLDGDDLTNQLDGIDHVFNHFYATR